MPTHEEIIGAWQGLNSDERFRALSYEEQQKIRAQWAERNLPKDPTFSTLSPAAQAQAFQKLVTRPPAFAEQNEFVTETVGLAERARAGDFEALRAGAAQVAGYRATQNAGPIYNMASALGEKLGIEGAENVRPTEAGSEDEKALQYLQQVVQNSDDKTFWQGLLVGVSPFAGIATNILSGRVAAGPMLAANAQWGAQAAASRAAGSPFTRWMFRSAVPEVFESTLDGVMMTANDIVSQQLQANVPFGMEAKSRLGNIALNFGSNFAGDMLFFGAASLAGASFRTMRSTMRGWGTKAAADVSDADLNGMAQAMVSGENLPREVLDLIPEESRSTFMRYKRAFAAADNLDEMSVADRAQFVALGKGHEIVKDGQTFVVRDTVTGATIPGRFSNETRALRGLMDFMESPPAQKARALDMAATNEVSVQRLARVRFGEQLPELDANTLARTLTPGEGGRLNPQPIQTATRSMVQQAGGGADIASKVEVRSVPAEAYWKMSDEARVQGSRIYVPETVRTTEDMTRFLDRYTADVGKLVPEGTEAVRRYATDVGQRVGEVQSATNPMYVEANAVRNGVDFQPMGNGSFRVGNEVVGSIKEADEAVQRQILFASEDAIHEAYGRQFGFEFVQRDGMWHVRGKQAEKGGNVLTGNHSTPEAAARELWDKGFKPRVTQTNAPHIVITPEGDGLEIRKLEGMAESNVVSGPIEYVRDFAKRYFADIPEAKILRQFGSNHIGKVENVYRVVSPEWGVISEFTSFGKAEKFLKASRDSLESLQEMGLLKGVPDISINGGQIVARPIGEKARHFETVGALKDWLKAKVPDPVWQKELSNFDTETIRRVWDDMPDEYREMYLRKSGVPEPRSWDDVLNYMKDRPTWSPTSPTGEYGRIKAGKYATWNVGQLIKDAFQSPTYARMRRITGQEGQELLTASFEQAEKQLKNFRAIHTQASELVDGISRFKGAPNRKRRAALRPLLEIDPGDIDAKASAWNIELTDADRRYMERFRSVSDTLGQSFGIDTYKMISGYLPRIREFMKANPDVVRGASTAKEVLGKMETRMAKELEFFSDYLRVDELATFVNEADPQEILANYARKGVKNMTLGKTYEILMKRWNDVLGDGSVTPSAKFSMLRYMESLMGMYSDEASKAAEQSAREIGSIMANRMKAGPNAGAVKDFVNTLHGFTIAAVMSFRPWPIIRNMQQVWTTLAPMFGNDSVMRAMKVLSNDKQAGEVYQRLIGSGRLQDRIPIFGGVYEAVGITARLNKLGMKWYKNSDDYTRMMVDVVVRDTFADAVAKFEANPNMAPKKFIRLANLHRLDDFDQQEIIKRLRGNWTDAGGRVHAGGFDEAMDYYGDIVTRETMFAYTAGSNPMMFNGMWGRLFGMFGHYPVYYAQTILNGLRRGNIADKAQFVGRVALNSAVLWFAFEKVWGIKADAFMPWQTAFFDGGPYYKMLNKTLEAAAGSPGSSWDDVFTDINRLFIPGSLQARNVAEGARMMQQGNGYQGFLKMMSAPLAD